MRTRDVTTAMAALLDQPDPPDLCTPGGAGRRFRETVPGREDRHAQLVPQACAHRTYALVARENERLQ